MNNIRSCIKNKVILVLLLLAATLVSCNRERMVTVDLARAWDSTRVLENPDKGWYHHMLDAGIGKYLIQDEEQFHAFPGMDHLYLRLAWAFLEPEEGIYNWEVIDTIIDKYVPLGYGISFRISCKETGWAPHSIPEVVDGIGYATPSWVRKAGAAGVIPERNNPVWSPDWDDPVFLEKLDHFHRVFAERYDGKPWVRYVDIGSIGDWGEGHTSASTKIPPTVEEVKAHIDLHVAHYRNSQLACTDDLIYYKKDSAEVQELYDYAVSNGITMRDDSPMGEWYVQTRWDSWSVSHPDFYDPLYLDKPTILETAHYYKIKNWDYWKGRNGSEILPELGVSGADILRGVIRTMHATWIGFHGYVGEYLADNPDLPGEMLNLCGYWYFPVSASHPAVFRRGEENPLQVEMRNKGVAPAYENYVLVLAFEPQDEGGSFRVTIPDAGNRSWLPDEQAVSNYSFLIPEEAAAGVYRLGMKLQKEAPGMVRDVHLAVSESLLDRGNFLVIGEVTIR